MRVGKLYIKIFLSFLGVLIITEVLILGVFMGTAGKEFHTRFLQFARIQADLLRADVEDTLAEQPHVPPAENSRLSRRLSRIAEVHQALIWIEDGQGRVVFATFEGDPPDASQFESDHEAMTLGDITVFTPHHDDGWGALVNIPLRFPNAGSGSIHLLRRTPVTELDHGPFVLGLLIIGGAIALLVVPVSRLITRPLKRLQGSALRVADGDLSHRATITGRDEISDLGGALNHMAESLERKIRGSKELTANISHELRTPLARLRIAQELLRDSLPPGAADRTQSRFEAMDADIDELDRLIGRILDLSKLDLSDQPLRMKTLDPAELMDNMAHRFSPGVEHKQLNVERFFPASAPRIQADPELLDTALSNLMDNAVKYSAEQGVIGLRVSSTHEGNHVELAITNTCAPLSEQDLARLFEPFHRAHKGGEGTGLGLAIARRIVQRHGGELSASNTDTGLEVAIRLPRSSDSA
ncbi:MAG: sensor histidine kinase [Desulfovibrio sp.]|nr:MAG: sensor histidine kinase [Desulfovibrio sp.]